MGGPVSLRVGVSCETSNMSKAFTKEDDGGLDAEVDDDIEGVRDDAEEALDASLGRNLITPEGLAALRAELNRTRGRERREGTAVQPFRRGPLALGTSPQTRSRSRSVLRAE